MTVFVLVEDHNSSAEMAEVRGVFASVDLAQRSMPERTWAPYREGWYTEDDDGDFWWRIEPHELSS